MVAVDFVEEAVLFRADFRQCPERLFQLLHIDVAARRSNACEGATSGERIAEAQVNDPVTPVGIDHSKQQERRDWIVVAVTTVG